MTFKIVLILKNSVKADRRLLKCGNFFTLGFVMFFFCSFTFLYYQGSVCLYSFNIVWILAVCRYSYPCTGLLEAWGFQEFKAHRFQDSRNMKVVRSALRTSRLYPLENIAATHFLCRSEWPGSLRRTSAVTSLLKLWVRILPGTWMFVCCECCVLSGRGLCNELITHPEESCQLWCVVVCDLETSWMRRTWLTGGVSRQKQTHFFRSWIYRSVIGRRGRLFQWKIPMKPSGIELATFRLVVQYLKQLRHCVPHINWASYLLKDRSAMLFSLALCVHIPSAVQMLSHRVADKSLARSTSRCVLFDG